MDKFENAGSAQKKATKEATDDQSFKIFIFASDPDTNFRPNQLDFICNIVNDQIIHGLYVRSLDLLSKNNQHGMCFETFSLLGFITARLQRGELGACILDPFDYSTSALVHMLASLLSINPSITFQVSLGIRHNAADQEDRIAAFGSKLVEITDSLTKIANSISVDKNRLTWGLVGRRTIDKLVQEKHALLEMVRNVVVPAGSTFSSQHKLPSHIERHAFAAVKLDDSISVIETKIGSNWVVQESTFRHYVSELRNEGYRRVIFNAQSLRSKGQLWYGALKKIHALDA